LRPTWLCSKEGLHGSSRLYILYLCNFFSKGSRAQQQWISSTNGISKRARTETYNTLRTLPESIESTRFPFAQRCKYSRIGATTAHASSADSTMEKDSENTRALDEKHGPFVCACDEESCKYTVESGRIKISRNWTRSCIFSRHCDRVHECMPSRIDGLQISTRMYAISRLANKRPDRISA
jgi:hypothetical protein